MSSVVDIGVTLYHIYGTDTLRFSRAAALEVGRLSER